MAVLKLGAVDLGNRAGILDKRFRRGFDGSRLAGSGGPEKKEIGNRTSRRGHACQIDLVAVDDVLNGFVLADDEFTQVRLERFRFPPGLGRIQWNIYPQHCFGPNPATRLKY